MRIEVRASGGLPCDKCGARELIHVPSSNDRLEADILAAFEAEAPRHRVFKRAAYRHLRRELVRVCDELRAATIHI